ncbi:unnamed protein product [Leptidea sinapis]|uniref:Phorbol-ester/DAG-type domain-containing protein n=1 Tax=Leptidea sinapis TaxID=189913 RepID=A0A5E4PUJ3_9NEOP|nr:unnamed protein product [Leptidea sinapis]
MAKCSGCGKFLSSSGAVVCTNCPCIFHKGCVAIPDNTAIPKNPAQNAKKKQPRGDNSSTPVKSLCGAVSPPVSVNNVSTKSTEGTLTLSHANSTLVGDSEMRDMRRELADLISELREFRKEFRQSISSIGERMDGFEKRLEAVEHRELAVTTPITNEVVELQETVSQLRLQLNERDQESLLADLDIGHIPEIKEENPVHIETSSPPSLVSLWRTETLSLPSGLERQT